LAHGSSQAPSLLGYVQAAVAGIGSRAYGSVRARRWSRAARVTLLPA
jgi:hypothetical protein